MPIVTTSSRKKRTSGLPLVLVAAVALVAVAAAFFMINGNHGATPQNLEPRTQDQGPRTKGQEPSTPQNPEPGTQNLERREAAQNLERREAAQNLEPGTLNPEPSSVSAAEAAREAWRIADSNRLAKSEAILAAAAPKKHFDNDVENTLDIVSKPGAQFLMIPQVDLSREEVLTYLKKPVEIYEDDDGETVAAKERTAEVKAAALKFIEDGGTINQFIRDCVAAETEASETVREIQREKSRIVREQGLEAAQAYLDEVNPQLREAGLPEVKIGRADIKSAKRSETK